MFEITSVSRSILEYIYIQKCRLSSIKSCGLSFNYYKFSYHKKLIFTIFAKIVAYRLPNSLKNYGEREICFFLIFYEGRFEEKMKEWSSLEVIINISFVGA